MIERERMKRGGCRKPGGKWGRSGDEAVEEGVKNEVVGELHRTARRRFKRRKYNLKGVDDLWQADLVDMKAYARFNNNFKHLLTVIDAFSKFAWAVPVKSKKGVDVVDALSTILTSSGRKPINLHTDEGGEFYNAEFRRLMREKGVHHYSTYSVMKASIVERFNRTLKSAMWKKFSLRGSYTWTDILPRLLKDYNGSVHSTIRLKPSEASILSRRGETELRNRAYKIAPSSTHRPPKFSIGDSVRVSKHKTVFAKGYTPNWSTEIFKILKVQPTRPVTYLLEDYEEKPISGCFYEEELQKAAYPDVFLVEKILRRKTMSDGARQMFVKWLGFDDSHNSWINIS